MQRWFPKRRRRRRLQRDPDFTGTRLTSFREVFLRHGLPGLTLALLCLAVPTLSSVFAESLSSVSSRPARYLAGFTIILVALNLYTWSLDRAWQLSKFGWVAYLGALSCWEEWVFRLAIPQILEAAGVAVWGAATLSALVFGAAHYFTLRWKWQWCVGAVFGSLYFSYQMELHGDLLFVAAIHWVATTINTPRPPGQKSTSET